MRHRLGPRALGAAAVLGLAVGFAPAADAQERVTWTMATSWPSGLIPQLWAEDFAERVSAMTGGSFAIEVHPGGALVGPFEVLDAVHTGTIDAGHSITHYWLGKHHAFPFFASVPMALDVPMYFVWLYERGGLELWNRLYEEQLGLDVVAFPLGFNATEFLAWSHRPLEEVEDFQGLKYRTVGWWGEILRGMGVSVTTLPAAELYPSLERRVLDATEFASPAIDRNLGFYEITDYVTGPGMHQPASAGELTVNRAVWERLPEHYKAIVRTAAEAVTLRGWTMDYAESMDAFEYFQEQGVQFVRVSEEAQRAFREQAWAYLDEQAASDPFFAEVWESVRGFYESATAFDKFMLPVRE